MTAILRYALKSLVRRPATGLLLFSGASLVFLLPTLPGAVGRAFQQELETRATAAPLVIGAAGSATDLVLHALYFRTEPPGRMQVGDWRRYAGRADITLIPLLATTRSESAPVVGTGGDYFALRGLRLAAGKSLSDVGDCIVGAAVARKRELQPSDEIVTELTNLLSPAAGVGTRLRVVGVLQATGTADDQVIFTSLPTAWFIAGLGHSHAKPEQSHAEMPVSGSGVREMAAENFHFHGNRAAFPLSALIAVPQTERSRLLLAGSFILEGETRLQIADSREVIERLTATTFRVTELFEQIAVAVAVAAGMLTMAIVLLTLQLRRSEITLMNRLGLPRWKVASLFATEFGVVLIASGLMALLLGQAVLAAGPRVVRFLVG